jgi:hypothetical protein
MKKRNSILIGIVIWVLLFSICMNNAMQIGWRQNGVQNFQKTNFGLETLDTSNWEWTGTVVVSVGSTDDAYYPKIAADLEGNIHVVWYDGTDYGTDGPDLDIFYRCWKANTTQWGSIELVSNVSIGDSCNPAIAVDKEGNAHIVWDDDIDDGDIFYRCLNATTGLWAEMEVVSTESTAPSVNPAIAVDEIGNIHVAWADFTNYGGAGLYPPHIFYKYYNTTSKLWNKTALVNIESKRDATFPTIAVDDGRNVHIAWEDCSNYLGTGNDGEIFYKCWNASTASWMSTVIITDDEYYSLRPQIIADSLGKIHIVWAQHTGSGTCYEIMYTNLNLTSGSWSENEFISDLDLKSSETPAIGVDSSGNIYVTWADAYDYSGTGYNIVYKVRNASSTVWGTMTIISTESDGTSNNPSIAIDLSGYIHIVWDDRTNYQGSGIDRDIFYKKFAEPSVNGIPGFNLAPILFAAIGLVALYQIFRKKIFTAKQRFS